MNMPSPYVLTTNSTNFVIQDELIVSVDNTFEFFTGYNIQEVYKRPVAIVFNEMLQIKVNINDLSEVPSKNTYHMFTRFNEEKKIDIIIKQESELNITVCYLIELTEIGLKEKFNFMKMQFIDNVIGLAVFSVPDLILLTANQKYLDYLGYPHNTLENSVGHYASEIIDDWSGSILERAWEIVLSTQKPQYLKEQARISIDKRITYWDKTITPVFENGVCKYVYSYNEDITDKITAKNQLSEKSEIIRQQKEQLESIIENMSEGLFIVDKNKHITLLNGGAKDYFYTEKSQQQMLEELEQTKYYDFEGTEINIIDFIGKNFVSGDKIKSLRLAVKRTDEIKYYGVSGSPISDKNGHINSFLLCTRDITKYIENSNLIREQRESLLQSEIERNQTLEKIIIMRDEFLSMISHEFKTPLNVINSAIQAMEFLCENELPPRVRRYIKSIQQNTFRQMKLVNNLLDITCIRTDNIRLCKKNIDIVFLTRSIVESASLYAQQRTTHIKFMSTIKERFIGIDEEKYERVLLNLLSNAIKFTPKKKQIAVKLSLTKDYVRIEVKDNGRGIPKGKQDLIFERFEQVDSSLSRQAEGTGIGLSLVKSLVNALGGQITLKSKEGKGSNFIVLLPDEKIQDNISEKTIPRSANDRLTQSLSIEFSDIHFS